MWAQLVTCVFIQASQVCWYLVCLPRFQDPALCVRVVPVVANLAAFSVTSSGRTYYDFVGSGKTPREGPIYPSHFIRGLAYLPLDVAEKSFVYHTCMGDGKSCFSCSDKAATLTL